MNVTLVINYNFYQIIKKIGINIKLYLIMMEIKYLESLLTYDDLYLYMIINIIYK